MGSTPELSMTGSSASRAYEDETAGSDCSSKAATNRDVELITDQQFNLGIVPPSKPSWKDIRDKTLSPKVPLGPPGTMARKLNAKTTRPQRPQGLQHSTPVSAPEILQLLPREHTATVEHGALRSLSQGYSTSHSGALNQSLQTLQRTRESDNALLTATPSPKKRRRSHQDAAQTNDRVQQGYSLSLPTLIHSRSLSSGSSPLPTNSPCLGKHEETSKGNASETNSHPNDDNDPQSRRSSDTDLEHSPGSHLLGTRRNASVSGPPFEPFHQKRISIARVTHKVFDAMQTVLSEKKDSDDGYIYTLRLAERPGFVKIGRTKNPIDKRKSQINRCITYNLEVVNDDDFCPVENHTRVEKLIHEELRNYRRGFLCTCKQTKPHGDASDGMTTHGEWFKIDEAKAVEVVTRWRKWMSTKPYRDGSLKHREKLKINIYHKDLDRMNAMVTGEDEDWRWDIFMRDTPWQLCRLWLYANLFQERYERPTCSPWDSLLKHWKSNVLFGLVFFLLSCCLSVLSQFLLLSFAFAPSPAVLNTLVLGSGAILYAA